MRPQYHFRPTDRGMLIWDVRRLLELAKELPCETVALTEIREIDEPYWFGHDAPTCRAILDHLKLVEAADPSYPILLSAQGRVMDGMHRVVKALWEERSTIEARRFVVDPEPDYVDVDPKDLAY